MRSVAQVSARYVPAHTGSEYAYSSGDSHLWKKHEPNKKPICTQIYFQNDRDAHHSNRVEWSGVSVEWKWVLEWEWDWEWAPVTGHRMQINLWAAAGSPHPLAQDLSILKASCVWRSREWVSLLEVSRSPEVQKSRSPGSKLDRNHEISLQQSLLATSGDKLNCAYSCINCTHTREDGVAGPPECVN